jgi:hypothetical protein
LEFGSDDIDTDHNGVISMAELTADVAKHLEELTGGDQQLGLDQRFQGDVFVAGLWTDLMRLPEGALWQLLPGPDMPCQVCAVVEPLRAAAPSPPFRAHRHRCSFLEGYRPWNQPTGTAISAGGIQPGGAKMNGDPAQKGREPLMERIIGWIRTRSVWLWPAIGIVFALLFTLFVIQPFGTGGALNDDDVAAAWTTSISRLGILPVYPPSEDIHVGDLWGVVADAEDTLLLNKAVRLAQINLRDEVVGDARGPMFADTQPYFGKDQTASLSSLEARSLHGSPPRRFRLCITDHITKVVDL